MFGSTDVLLDFAEVAIALAGFSAIVVVLKRGAEGKWDAVDADRFHGMVIHSTCAVLFCFLPSIVNVLVQDVVTTLHICCAILGVQIVLHCIGVMFSLTTNLAGKISLAFGFLFAAVQFAAFTDWGTHRELEFYVLGVIWHIIQAGVLFVMLVWVKSEDMDRAA